MKICPVCKKTYSDDSLNYCLADGGILQYHDDAAPTVILNQARQTNPNNWTRTEPLSNWQSQPLQNRPTAVMSPMRIQSQNTTLPILSLILGICGLVFVCCYSGLPLGLAAVITGYIGLTNANNNPAEYGGRGLAIAGITLGAIGFLISFGLVLMWLSV